MPFASSLNLRLSLCAEDVLGVTPVSGIRQMLRTTGPSFKVGLGYEESKEVRSDRALADMSVTSLEVSGSIGFEASFEEYDNLMQATLMGEWGSTISLSLQCSVEVGTTAVIRASAGTPFTNSMVGRYVHVSGFTRTANNGFFRVAGVVGGGSGLAIALVEGLLAESVRSVRIQSSRLSHGTNLRSFSIEENYSDIKQFRVFKGMVPSKMALDIQAGQLVKGSFEFLGMTSELAQASPLPSDFVASKAGSPMSAVLGVGQIYEAGVTLPNAQFKSLSIEVDNTLRGQEAIGRLGYVGISAGSFKVTGKAQLYFSDSNVYQKFITGANTSLSWSIKDSSNSGYGFTLPRLKIHEANITGGSIDSDFMVDISFTALFDPITGIVMAIDRAGPGEAATAAVNVTESTSGHLWVAGDTLNFAGADLTAPLAAPASVGSVASANRLLSAPIIQPNAALRPDLKRVGNVWSWDFAQGDDLYASPPLPLNLLNPITVVVAFKSSVYAPDASVMYETADLSFITTPSKVCIASRTFVPSGVPSDAEYLFGSDSPEAPCEVYGVFYAAKPLSITEIRSIGLYLAERAGANLFNPL